MKIIDLKIENHSARIYEPENQPKEVLIAVHGFAGDKDSSVIIAVAEDLANYGIATISFELPNHGAGACEDVLKLISCVKSLSEIISYAKATYSDLPISVFATSFGAFLTLQHLKNNKEYFKNVILRSPAIDMANILVNNILPEHNLTIKDFKSVQDLGYGAPLYINKQFIDDLYANAIGDDFKEENNNYYLLQGLKDDIVNPDFVFEFVDKHFKNRCEIFKFENADHRYKNPGELEQIVKITRKIMVG